MPNYHRMLNDPGYPWRREKRFHRRGLGDGGQAMYEAWLLGCWAADFRPGKRNPYPPGKRHDEFERGRGLGFAQASSSLDS
jgi:hypothetical protein